MTSTMRSSSASGAHFATTTVRVEGMTCGACTSAVEKGFEGIDGIGSVSVSLVLERAVVQHNPDKISAEKITDLIEDRGFDATVVSTDTPLPPISDFEDVLPDHDEASLGYASYSITTVAISGMTCGACTAAVEGAFKDVPGVKTFSISLLSERAVIEHDSIILTPDKISEIIEDAGFDARVVSTKLETPDPSGTVGRNKQVSQPPSITTTIAIEGMTCGACTSAVESGFKDVKGMLQFNISLLAERAVIIHTAILSVDQILELIEDRGFGARLVSSQNTDAQTGHTSQSVQLKIYGLPDTEAAQRLESTIAQLSGVSQAKITFTSSRVSISHDPTIIGLRAIVEVIESIGYNALLAEADDNSAQLESLAKLKEIHEWRRSFYVSLAFAIPVFLTSMAFPMFIKPLDYGSLQLPIIPGLWLGDVVCLLLTLPVQFGIGKRFYVSAFKSLRHGSPTMDVLVVMGTSAAFFFSVTAMMVSILMPPHTRPATVFDTSTMLITFITLGRYLENCAKSQTSKALSRLMSLAPSMATIYADPIAAQKLADVLDKSPQQYESSEKALEGAIRNESEFSQEKVIPTELIQVGDVVILRPGDKIPADGTVIRGDSYVDESMVTGEPMPVLKFKNSLLVAGTVNGAGRLDFRVSRAGRDTQLSQIVRLVQEAQTNRAPIQRMADKVAGYFVPIILGLGLATFVVWMVLSHVLSRPPAIFLDEQSGGRIMICMQLCISVIVFACPCALGLSTPTAVMVGTGVGAEQGILVKGGAALETATKITHVIFDKTGTLTSGKMSVSRTDIVPPTTEWSAAHHKAWWSAVGLAEMSSEHPIAKAIVRAAKVELDIGSEGSFDGSVDEFSNSVGSGIFATVTFVLDGKRQTRSVHAGNAKFLEKNSIAIFGGRKLSTGGPAVPGQTSIYIAIDKVYAGVLHLSDTLKPSAAATINALARMGIPSSIVTGDAAETAHVIAAMVNIPKANVHASASPDAKRALVQEMQAAGHIVAMVGDGINDSPALATADIGISLASGTDVAMEAAEVVLMRPDDLLDVAGALHLARSIFSRIKLNLAWACGYNFIGLPFAMGVFLPWGIRLHPMAAGAAMAASSVSVVASSLLLKFWRRPGWMSISNLEKSAQIPRTTFVSNVKSAYNRARNAVGLRTGKSEHAYIPLSNTEEDV